VRLVAGIAPGDEIHRLQHRDAGRDAERRQQSIDAAAGRVHDQARADLDGPAAERIADTHPRHPLAVDEQRDRLDMVRQHGAMLGCGEREGEREAIRFGRHVVVEHRGAGQPLAAESRKRLCRAAAREHTAAGQAMGRRHTAIATSGKDAIEDEPCAHGHLAAHQRTVERQREGERPHRVRCDPRGRSAFVCRLARPANVQRLQVSQAAWIVRRWLKDAPLPKSSRSTRATDPRCAASCDRQTINAADHDNVEGPAGQRVRSRIITGISLLLAPIV
jgi:hypothetical protein